MSHAAVDMNMVLSRDNVELSAGSGSALSKLLMGLGALFIGITFFAGIAGSKADAAASMHAYHAGFLATIGFSVAALGLVMIFHQTNAGWCASIRRQFENLMSLWWVGGLLFVVTLIFQWVFSASKGVYLWEWMDPKYIAGDILYEHKAGFLNQPFFYIRCIIYFAIWGLLAMSLWKLSTTQDSDGDVRHTMRARTLSAPGLLLFAFTTAFAGFDWAMTLDFHWFSTMYGVYFFAGNMVACLALTAIVLIVLRTFGRLHVAFTDEHLHDLTKLVFAFTVFWAYISFSQYFLIWYANIPEETAWMSRRKTGDWEWLSWLLPIGHFIVPFLILLPRPMRRSRALVALMCAWLIVMHVMDVYWAVRPEAKVKGEISIIGPKWVDVMGLAGPVLVFMGALIRQIASGPLMPLKDPRLKEALKHKNYV